MASSTPARCDRIHPSDSTKQTAAGVQPGKFRPRGERREKTSALGKSDCGPDVFEHVLTEMKNETDSQRRQQMWETPRSSLNLLTSCSSLLWAFFNPRAAVIWQLARGRSV